MALERGTQTECHTDQGFGFAGVEGAVAGAGELGGWGGAGTATAGKGLKFVHLMVTRIGISRSFILYVPSERE